MCMNGHCYINTWATLSFDECTFFLFIKSIRSGNIFFLDSIPTKCSESMYSHVIKDISSLKIWEAND